MKLNESIPGLPKWPVIEFDEKANECVVRAPHISYPRYRIAMWISNLLYLSYLVVAAKIAFQQPTGALAFAVGFKLFILFSIYMIFVRTPRVLARFIFPKRTVVRFRADEFWIDDKKFSLHPGLTIQFRSWEPAASPERLEELWEIKSSKKKKLDWDRELELKFYKVEMVYGARIENITSLFDEKRAQQFAVALQQGLEFMAKQQANPTCVPELRNAVAEDSLPE